MVSPARILRASIDWTATNGVWWASSLVAHLVVLSCVLLLLGKVATAPPEGEAPAFEAKVDTEIPQPQLDHFDVGQTPIEPSELTTDTLSLVDAPTIDAEAPSTESAEAAMASGGSSAAAGGGMGGLDRFAVKALGPGPLVRGSGLAASGSGRGIGGGGIGSGFGARGNKDARRAMIGGYGGTKASERAVAAALNWFARHQNLDGSWSLGAFPQMCKGDPCSGAGKSKSDIAATAMALLPFLAAGQTHLSQGPYRHTIEMGLKWLIGHQRPNGDLTGGATMYTHGLAAITLCEAYGLTKDSHVGIPAQQAIRFIESSSNPSTGGWHYAPNPTTIGDTSVVGWQIMALKSAQMAGLEVGESAIDGGINGSRACRTARNTDCFPTSPPRGRRPA